VSINKIQHEILNDANDWAGINYCLYKCTKKLGISTRIGTIVDRKKSTETSWSSV